MSTQRKRIKEDLLKDPKTFGTTLIAILFEDYTTDALSFDTLTISTELSKEYGVIPASNYDKLFAMCTVYTTDLFFTSLNSFMNIANALNGGTDFVNFDPVTSDEAAWAIIEVLLNVPLERGEKLADKFHPDIKAYLGVMLDYEGIITPPPPLNIAIQPNATNPELRWYEETPSLTTGIHKLSIAKALAINDIIKSNIITLFQQLQQLKNTRIDPAYIDKVLQITQIE